MTLNPYDTWNNAIKTAMANKIYEHFSPYFGGNVNIHTEEMEQGFERPAFFIMIGYISTDKRMNYSWDYHYSMRVRYHAEDKEGTNDTESEYDELSAVGEMLTECLGEIQLPIGDIDSNELMLVRADTTNYAPSENKKVLIYQTTYHLRLHKKLEDIPLMGTVDVETHTVAEGE